jgi:hypothetical protein
MAGHLMRKEARKKARRTVNRQPHRRLLVESLEDRRLLALAVNAWFNDSAVSENVQSTLCVSYPAPVGDPHSLTITWGDGAWQSFSVTGTGSCFYHTYVDDNPSGTPSDNYYAYVHVSDGVDEGTDWATLLVVNSPPSLTADNVYASESDYGTLSGVFYDPGPSDSLQLVIDWGDGATDTISGSPGQSFTVSHWFSDDLNGSINLWLTDDDGGSYSTSVAVSVANRPPSLYVDSSPHYTSEGQSFSLSLSISDVPSDSVYAVIDWGDGATATVYGQGQHYPSHTYYDDNPSGTPSDSYNIVVTAYDDDGGSTSTSFYYTVYNLPPSLSANSVYASESDYGTLSGVFYDPGPSDSLQLVIDWGDGATETISGSPGQSFTVSHWFSDDLSGYINLWLTET